MKLSVCCRRQKGDSIAFQIAEIVFALTSERQMRLIRIEKVYQDFFCGKEPDITIHASYNGLPQTPILREEDKAFDSEMIWSLYRVEGKNVFALRSPVFGPLPYRVAVFENDFRHGKVYSVPAGAPDDLLPNPLEYPLSEALMVCLLAQRRGLMVHACGIDDSGHGYLFAGNSTHGKSTMAKIWTNTTKATILNDDRIILRKHDGRFWMYGTPWHGEYNQVSSKGVCLEKIFFLRHAQTNDLHRVEGAMTASMLLARCFPPLWDATGMQYTLDFCDQLIENTPSYELSFAPDERIVDFVRCVR